MPCVGICLPGVPAVIQDGFGNCEGDDGWGCGGWKGYTWVRVGICKGGG